MGGLKPAYGLRTGGGWVGGTTAAYILYESGVGLLESVSEDEGEPVIIARGKNIPVHRNIFDVMLNPWTSIVPYYCITVVNNY